MRLVAAFATAMLVGTALAASPREYDKEVRILHVHFHTDKHHYTVGEGVGNIIDPARGQIGFDWISEGCMGFEPTRGPERLQARWKDEPHRLEIVIPQIGSDHTSTCTLKVTVKEFRYVYRNGGLGTEPFAGSREGPGPGPGGLQPRGPGAPPQPPPAEQQPPQAE